MSLILSDGPEGQFEGYASVFGAMDMARDVVMPGAFAASIARLGAGGIKLLWQHDPAQPVGVWTEISEDQRGLFCRGALNLDVQRGRELFALLRQRAVNGLSIGFKTVSSQTDKADAEAREDRSLGDFNCDVSSAAGGADRRCEAGGGGVFTR